MGLFKPDKPKPPPPPPSAPTLARSQTFVAGSPAAVAPLSSGVSTGPQGLLTRAETRKRTLIGGSGE